MKEVVFDDEPVAVQENVTCGGLLSGMVSLIFRSEESFSLSRVYLLRGKRTGDIAHLEILLDSQSTFVAHHVIPLIIFFASRWDLRLHSSADLIVLTH